MWTVLEPLFLFIIFYIVFSTIRSGPAENFAIYLISGIIFFHLFSRGTMGGLLSLRSNIGILKSLQLNKELFPVIVTGTTILFLLVQTGVLFGLMPLFQFIPNWTIVFLPILYILFMFLVLGVNYLLSIVYVYVKDIQPFWGIFLYGMLFLSPIFWFVDEVDGILLEIQKINPLGQIIEISHKIIVFGEVPPLNDWLYTSAIIFGIFFLGYGIFQKFEKKVVEAL